MNVADNKYNLTMWQGSTFGIAVVVKDASEKVQDLTGYSARMQIRPSYKSNTVTESMTSSNGEIVIDSANGELSLVLTASRTANISVGASTSKPPRTNYVYDLELQDSGGTVSKILYGDLIVYGEVTR